MAHQNEAVHLPGELVDTSFHPFERIGHFPSERFIKRSELDGNADKTKFDAVNIFDYIWIEKWFLRTRFKQVRTDDIKIRIIIQRFQIIDFKCDPLIISECCHITARLVQKIDIASAECRLCIRMGAVYMVTKVCI